MSVAETRELSRAPTASSGCSKAQTRKGVTFYSSIPPTTLPLWSRPFRPQIWRQGKAGARFFEGFLPNASWARRGAPLRGRRHGGSISALERFYREKPVQEVRSPTRRRHPQPFAPHRHGGGLSSALRARPTTPSRRKHHHCAETSTSLGFEPQLVYSCRLAAD